MNDEQIRQFIKKYCDMKKFDLITEIIDKYSNHTYFSQRKVWTNRTRIDLMIILYEFELNKINPVENSVKENTNE